MTRCHHASSLLHFLNDRGKKQTYIYIHVMFVTFVLIFKFIFIYLLHVLFVLKIEGIFGKKSPTRQNLSFKTLI